MKCPICGREIDDAALLCPVCDTHVAERMQEETIALRKKDANTCVRGVLHSPRFLIVAIALSLIAVFGVFSLVMQLIDGNWITALIGVAPMIGAFIAMVAAWVVYGKKKN